MRKCQRADGRAQNGSRRARAQHVRCSRECHTAEIERAPSAGGGRDAEEAEEAALGSDGSWTPRIERGVPSKTRKTRASSSGRDLSDARRACLPPASEFYGFQEEDRPAERDEAEEKQRQQEARVDEAVQLYCECLMFDGNVPSVVLSMLDDDDGDFLPSVFGMSACKRLVKRYLIRPHVFPDLYCLAGMPLHFALIGDSGSGKRNLVRNACAEFGINFVRLHNHVYTRDLLRHACDFAGRRKPCVVYLDEYDDAFCAGENSIFMQDYSAHIVSGGVVDACDEVWLAFGLKSESPITSCHELACTVQERRARCEPLVASQAIAFIDQRLRERHHTNLEKLLKSEHRAVLSKAAENCRPACIAAYLGRVFFSRLDREPAEQLSRHFDNHVQPLWEDFMRCLESVNADSNASCETQYMIPRTVPLV